jgi:hypothetical protein
MRKGLRARQGITLLRYASSVGMRLKWNLLWGFPGDRAESYQRTLAMVPWLRHLVPPQSLAHLHLDRFSPYFRDPEAHGITELRPMPCYADAFPPTADHDRLAYHFEGQYESGAHHDEGVIHALSDEVTAWRSAWEGRPPLLHVRRPRAGAFFLVDTRTEPRSFFIRPELARAVLVGGPLGTVEQADWAIRNRYALDLDGWCVPLATAAPDLLHELERA